MSKKYRKTEDFSDISEILDGRHQIIPIISSGEDDLEVDVAVPEIIPILTLRSSVLFPGAITPITVGRERSMRLVKEVNEEGGILGAVLQRDVEAENPGPDDLYRIGTAARILKILEMPNGNLTVILHGLEKFEIKEFVSSEPFFKATVEVLKDTIPEKKNLEFDALVDSIKDVALHIIHHSPAMPKEAS
ncbi:MAG: LON peptidase substrate-binding domain-containing protein, partial [Rikenellaceae bacterium]|nr:LON peptidase substrate-binding domain-containing protein [Rikenellaceae bacterium]